MPLEDLRDNGGVLMLSRSVRHAANSKGSEHAAVASLRIVNQARNRGFGPELGVV